MTMGSPTIKKSLFIWALPVWGGGSKPLPGWFGVGFGGAYLEENCTSTNRHLLDFGGVKKLARMVCGTYFTEGFLQGGFPETNSFCNHTTLQNVKIGPENRCHRVPV